MIKNKQESLERLLEEVQYWAGCKESLREAVGGLFFQLCVIQDDCYGEEYTIACPYTLYRLGVDTSIDKYILCEHQDSQQDIEELEELYRDLMPLINKVAEEIQNPPEVYTVHTVRDYEIQSLCKAILRNKLFLKIASEVDKLEVNLETKMCMVIKRVFEQSEVVYKDIRITFELGWQKLGAKGYGKYQKFTSNDWADFCRMKGYSI